MDNRFNDFVKMKINPSSLSHLHLLSNFLRSLDCEPNPNSKTLAYHLIFMRRPRSSETSEESKSTRTGGINPCVNRLAEPILSPASVCFLQLFDITSLWLNFSLLTLSGSLTIITRFYLRITMQVLRPRRKTIIFLA